MQVDAAVSLAGDRTADDVAQRQRRVALALRLAQGGERVGGLAGLGDGDDDGVAVDRRVAVAELAGVFDLDGDARELFQQVLAHEGGVVAGAARRQDDALHLAQPARVDVEAAEVGGRVGLVEPAAQGVLDRLGLLVDLLEHVVFVDAPVRLGGLGFDRVQGRGDALAVVVEHVPVVGGQDGQLVVLHVNDLVGLADQRGGVARQEVFVLADADDERAAEARAEDDAGEPRTDDAQAVGALEHAEALAQDIDEDRHGHVGVLVAVEAGVEFAADELRDDLGVGVAGELDPFGGELLLDRRVVLDDAVVDDGHGAVGGDVRVGVAVVGGAVGGPARVADADAAGRGVVAQGAGEVGDAPGLLAEVHPHAAGRGVLAHGEGGDAGAVVAPVLEPVQAGDEDLLRLLVPDVADDATHANVSSGRS